MSSGQMFVCNTWMLQIFPITRSSSSRTQISNLHATRFGSMTCQTVINMKNRNRYSIGGFLLKWLSVTVLGHIESQHRHVYVIVVEVQAFRVKVKWVNHVGIKESGFATLFIGKIFIPILELEAFSPTLGRRQKQFRVLLHLFGSTEAPRA